MANELSPQLEEIKHQFIINYANGGISAVEQMVEDLAAEAEAARALSEGAQEVEHDIIMAQDDVNPSDTVRGIEAVNEVTHDSMTAMSRHSFATHPLAALRQLP